MEKKELKETIELLDTVQELVIRLSGNLKAIEDAKLEGREIRDPELMYWSTEEVVEILRRIAYDRITLNQAIEAA